MNIFNAFQEYGKMSVQKKELVIFFMSETAMDFNQACNYVLTYPEDAVQRSQAIKVELEKIKKICKTHK